LVALSLLAHSIKRPVEWFKDKHAADGILIAVLRGACRFDTVCAETLRPRDATSCASVERCAAAAAAADEEGSFFCTAPRA